MPPEPATSYDLGRVEPPSTPRRGFPLLALFLLTSACGVLAGLVAPVLRAVREEHLGVEDVFWAALCGALLCLLGGMAIGLFQRRPLAGLAWGAPTGFCLGVIMGPLVLLPRDEAKTLFGTAVGGAVLLVVLAAATRLKAQDRS